MKHFASRAKTGFFLVLSLGVLIVPPAVSGPDFFFFTADHDLAKYDPGKGLPAGALNFQPYDDTPYFQSVFYQFSSEDGTDFFCHFLMGDLGFGLTKYGMDFKVRYPDGKVHYWGGEFDEDEVDLKTERYSWTMGKNTVSGDLAEHRLLLEQDGAVIDVALKFIAPIFRAGDAGMIYPEGDPEKYLQITFFTCFSAEGTITEGNTVILVKGWGYGDTVRGNFIGTDFARVCNGLRFYKDGLGFDTLEYVLTEERGSVLVPILIVHKDGKIVLVSKDHKKIVTDTFTEPRTKAELPAGFRLESNSDGLNATVEFSGVKLTDYNDPLKVLSPLERKVVQIVSEAPVDMRFDGDIKLSLTTKAGTEVREGRAFGIVVYSP